MLAVTPRDASPLRVWLQSRDPATGLGELTRELRFEMPPIRDAQPVRFPGEDAVAFVTIEEPTRRIAISRLTRQEVPEASPGRQEDVLAEVVGFSDGRTTDRSTRVVDLDGDGLPDVLATNKAGNSIVIYRQRPGTGLATGQSSPTFREPTFVAAGRWGGDRPSIFVASEAELAKAAAEVTGFPCFVKPVMSSSGKGQSYVERPDQIAEAWRYALEGGRVEQPRVIVEGRVDFDFEITQLTVRSLAGGVVETSFCAPIGHRQVKGDYVESWQPQPMSAAALSKTRDIAAAVTTALGGLGLFGVELFVKGDDVWFSEVSPRPHDTGLVTLVTQHQSEFALHARAILGLPTDAGLREPGASAVIYGGIDARGIAFEGVDEALAVPDADLRLFGKPESFERRRMGVALARAADVEQARERAREAAGKVRPVAG